MKVRASSFRGAGTFLRTLQAVTPDANRAVDKEGSSERHQGSSPPPGRLFGPILGVVLMQSHALAAFLPLPRRRPMPPLSREALSATNTSRQKFQHCWPAQEAYRTQDEAPEAQSTWFPKLLQPGLSWPNSEAPGMAGATRHRRGSCSRLWRALVRVQDIAKPCEGWNPWPGKRDT